MPVSIPSTIVSAAVVKRTDWALGRTMMMKRWEFMVVPGYHRECGGTVVQIYRTNIESPAATQKFTATATGDCAYITCRTFLDGVDLSFRKANINTITAIDVYLENLCIYKKYSRLPRLRSLHSRYKIAIAVPASLVVNTLTPYGYSTTCHTQLAFLLNKHGCFIDQGYRKF